MGYTQFPATSSYQEMPAAWVRLRGASFNTNPSVRATFSGRNFSPDNNFILPLQRYTAPNTASYAEVEPSGWEKFGQGVRDLFTGDVSKLGSMLMSSTGLDQVADFVGGIGGAALLDTSLNDMLFKSSAKRIHNFAWTLVSKNKKDADNLDKIANNLQSRMYPFMIDPVLNKVKPPEMWRIEIFPNNGGPSKYRFKSSSAVLENNIQLCVLTNFEVTRLAKNGPVLTIDNKYLALDISATFIEIEPVYRKWNITNVLGEAKHNTIYSRSKCTSGSLIGLGMGSLFTEAVTEVGDFVDDNIAQPVVDSIPGLNNLI